VGVPAPSSCRLYLVIAALSNRSQTNLAAFPAFKLHRKEHAWRDIDAERAPKRASRCAGRRQ